MTELPYWSLKASISPSPALKLACFFLPRQQQAAPQSSSSSPPRLVFIFSDAKPPISTLPFPCFFLRAPPQEPSLCRGAPDIHRSLQFGKRLSYCPIMGVESSSAGTYAWLPQDSSPVTTYHQSKASSLAFIFSQGSSVFIVQVPESTYRFFSEFPWAAFQAAGASAWGCTFPPRTAAAATGSSFWGPPPRSSSSAPCPLAPSTLSTALSCESPLFTAVA